MADDSPLNLTNMLGDVAGYLTLGDVPPDLKSYIMRRVHEKMVNDHGVPLNVSFGAQEYEEVRRTLYDELIRSVSHKRYEAATSCDDVLDKACKTAVDAIGSWYSLG